MCDLEDQDFFECKWGLCRMKFLVLGDLTQHVNHHYKYAKGAKCQWRNCWRTEGFEGGRHMLFHMNSHTGARPYQCPKCFKRFTTVPNYRTHVKNVHGMPNQPFIHVHYDQSRKCEFKRRKEPMAFPIVLSPYPSPCLSWREESCELTLPPIYDLNPTKVNQQTTLERSFETILKSMNRLQKVDFDEETKFELNNMELEFKNIYSFIKF